VLLNPLCGRSKGEGAPSVEVLRVVDAAGYPLEAAGDGVVFRPGSLFAGQERRIWLTLAVPHDRIGEHDLGRFSLAYGDGHDRTTLSFSETPRIACVAGEEEFYAGVDPVGWTRSVIADGSSKMQEDVARAVKAGRRDEALDKLHAFKAETSAMNSRALGLSPAPSGAATARISVSGARRTPAWRA
jgi:hypothetical protein